MSRSWLICYDPFYVCSYDNSNAITVANTTISATCVRTFNASANSTFDTTITTIATTITIPLPLILLLAVASYISATGVTIIYILTT